MRLSSSAECVQFERESFGALHQMLSGLDEAGRAAAWTEIAEQLAEFDGPDGFVGPCELMVGPLRRHVFPPAVVDFSRIFQPLLAGR